MTKYYALPLSDLRPSEFEAEGFDVVEFEIERDGETVTVIAPKGYELTRQDYAAISELVGEENEA